MKKLDREGLGVCDIRGEPGAVTMRTSVQAKEIPYAADCALLLLASASPCRPWTGASENFSAHCCRWAFAGAFSSVVHGLILLLLWGIKMPVPGAHSPSHAAIYVTLASPRVAQSDSSGNSLSAALPEEHQPAEEQHHKAENAVKEAKSQIHKSRPREVTSNLRARLPLTARHGSAGTASLGSRTLPAGGIEARAGVTTRAASDGGTAPQNDGTEGSAGQEGGRPSQGIIGGEEMAPLPLSAVAEAPVLIARTVPHYPDRARVLGIEGLVRLEAILNREGRIEQEIKVLESVPLLDEAASTALKQWRFQPARDGSGQPVRVILEVPFRFTLK